MTSPLRATTIAIRIGETVYHLSFVLSRSIHLEENMDDEKLNVAIEQLARTFLEIWVEEGREEIIEIRRVVNHATTRRTRPTISLMRASKSPKQISYRSNI